MQKQEMLSRGRELSIIVVKLTAQSVVEDEDEIFGFRKDQPFISFFQRQTSDRAHRSTNYLYHIK